MQKYNDKIHSLARTPNEGVCGVSVGLLGISFFSETSGARVKMKLIFLIIVSWFSPLIVVGENTYNGGRVIANTNNGKKEVADVITDQIKQLAPEPK